VRSSRKQPIIVVATALALLFSAQAAPTQTADQIAFRSLRTGNDDLFLVPATGGGATPLTATPERKLEASISSSGDIAFSAVPAGETVPSIFIRWAADGSITRLTPSAAADRAPAWTGNGNVIAFVRSLPPLGKSQVWRINKGGGGLQQLTGGPNGSPDDGLYGSPVWTHPFGPNSLAFPSDRAGGWPQLFSLPGTGGTPVPLTADPNAIHAHPDWTDDEGAPRIAFDFCCPAGGAADIYEMPAAGGAAAPLLADPALDESDPSYSAPVPQPSPSPSAPPTHIAYAQAPSAGGDRDIWTIDRATLLRTRLTDDPRADLSPDWSSVSPAPGPMAMPEGGTAGYQAAPARRWAGKHVKKPKRKVVEKVAPGVRLLMLRRAGPVQVFALRVNPKKRPAIDVALARGRLRGLQKTKGIARKNGAIAGINGDFALLGGRPSHAFAEDGDLKQTSFMSGPTFAMNKNQKAGFVADATPAVTAVETASGDVLPVDRWNNGPPVFGEIAGYTASGAGVDQPTGYECQARLSPTGARQWAPAKQGVLRGYTVQERGCFPWGLPASGDDVVLTAWSGSPEAFLIRTLEPGEPVSLTWSFGWSGVLEGIGGYPLLVANRQIVVGKCSESLCKRHPRTGIGITRKGKVLMVVVDGRQKKWSKGMTLVRFAKEMKKLGAAFAMNLDGGGSSTMVVGEKIVNRPSGGKQRPVSSAVLVLGRRDPGDTFARASGPSRAPARAWGASSASFTDPASTGGFLEALDAGAFGPPEPLAPELRKLLRAFRASSRR